MLWSNYWISRFSFWVGSIIAGINTTTNSLEEDMPLPEGIGRLRSRREWLQYSTLKPKLYIKLKFGQNKKTLVHSISLRNKEVYLCFSYKLRCGLISQSYFFVFVLVKGGEFHLDFWILLVPKMVISKLSGNTVRSTHPRLQKAFWYMTFHRKLNSINTKFDLRIKLLPIWCPDWLIWLQLKSGAS